MPAKGQGQPGAPGGDPEGDGPRIAVYEDDRAAPRVYYLDPIRLPDDAGHLPGGPSEFPDDAGGLRGYLREFTARVQQLVQQEGGCVPEEALEEILANLLHAGFAGAVITITDGGNTVRVTDQGPGIRDKERALRPGFTAAGPLVRGHIRGVGSGLPLARAALARLGGELVIEDNLDGGTVVTLSVPRLTSLPVAAVPMEELVNLGLTDRQLQALLLIVELGPVGPTRLAKELGVSPSTAYREIVPLDTARLVSTDRGGRRTVTEAGIAYLERVL